MEELGGHEGARLVRVGRRGCGGSLPRRRGPGRGGVGQAPDGVADGRQPPAHGVDLGAWPARKVRYREIPAALAGRGVKLWATHQHQSAQSDR